MLRVFLCHSSRDKGFVRDLYRRLTDDGVAAWLDEVNLLPGEDWDLEIKKAVRRVHAVIFCLSVSSVTRAGYVQKELRLSLDVADEQPEGTIFIIPIRIDNTTVPERLRQWQWVSHEDIDWYEKLLRALERRAESLQIPWTRPIAEQPVNRFSQRMIHLGAEKEYIAHHFCKMLFDRCRRLVDDEEKHIHLLIDSGTTLVPFFDYLAEGCIEAERSGEQWILDRRFNLVTNNLVGIGRLIKFDSAKANDFRQFVIPCEILPGNVQSGYLAATGQATLNAIHEIRSHNENSIIISLVTGNMVLLRHDAPHCPVPMARGVVHPPIKKALLDVSDEAFVIAPLVKMMIDANTEVNDLEYTKEGDQKFIAVQIQEVAERIKLVSTTRGRESVLYALSERVRNLLDVHVSGIDSDFVNAPLGKAPHVLFPYDGRNEDIEFSTWAKIK